MRGEPRIGRALIHRWDHHAFEVAGLPNHHQDPFDRLLVAQALVEGLALVTADDKLAPYGGRLLRA